MFYAKKGIPRELENLLVGLHVNIQVNYTLEPVRTRNIEDSYKIDISV